MQEGQPSRTALGAAVHRAAHQVLDGGRIFRDALALPILGDEGPGLVEEAGRDPERQRMRTFVAARSRFAEDSIDAARQGGVAQIVVLGAGLDTYACRCVSEGLRIFEVDHASTQAWKRERLAAAGIAVPPTLTFVPVDFEQESLVNALRGAGLRDDAATFFSWLGVTPYLTEASVLGTLGAVARHPGGAQIVFDYASPASALPPRWREAQARLAAAVAASGEPFRSAFETEKLHASLRALGYLAIEDLGPPQLAERYGGPPGGGHVVWASTLRDPSISATSK